MTSRTNHHRRVLRSLGAMLSLTVGLSLVSTMGSTADAATKSTPKSAAKAATKPASQTPKGVAVGDRLVIPSIGFNKAVVDGWTREINQGKIVLVGACWPGTPKTNSLPCSTTWIAGHHTTHGSPFKNLPLVKIGSLVTIIHAGVATTYKVTSKTSVSRANPPTWIFKQDLLLQCSDGANRAWAVNATLVGSKAA